MASYDWTKKIQAVPSIGGSVSTTDNRSAWTTPTRTDVSASLPDLPLLKSAYTEEEEKKVVKSPYVSQTKQEIEKKYGFTPAPQSAGKTIADKFTRWWMGTWSKKEMDAAEKVTKVASSPTYRYLSSRVGAGVSQAAYGVTSLPDTAARFVSKGYGIVRNAVSNKPDVKTDTTLTGLFTGENRYNEFTNWLVDQAAYDTSIASKQSVGKFTAFVGDILQNLPQQSIWAMGQYVPGLGEATTISQRMVEVPVGASNREFVAGALSGATSAAIESISDAWKFLPDALTVPVAKSATGFAGKLAAKSTVLSTIYQLIKVGAGEGAEELLEFPIQQLIEWKVTNPSAPASEYFNAETRKEWAYNGLVGFVSGAIIGVGSAVSTLPSSNTSRRIIEAETQKIAETPVEDFSKPEVQEAALEYLDLATAFIADPKTDIVDLIEKRATVTDVTASTRMPLEAPTSVSVVQQAPDTTPTAETPTSASIGVVEPSAQERVAQATKKPIADTITEIVDASASVEEARQKYSAMLDADESIVDEYANEIKTPEDLDIRIAELAKQVEASTDNPQGKAWDGKVNLQLLGLQRFAKRVLKVPEGSRAYSFMDNIIRYMNKTHDQRKMMRLENRIQTQDMFYERLHGKDVVEDAKAILNNPSKKIRGKNLQDMYDKLTLTKIDDAGKILTYELEPFEMVALSMYASELAANPDPNNIEADMLKADLIIRKISDRMTTAGQFTQAARYVYEQIYPEIRAKRIIDEFDRANKPIERADLDKRSTETERIINTNRKEAILDGFANLFRYAEIPAEQLKQRIEADLNPQTDKQRNDITEMVNTLFRIYKETNPGQRAVTDPYAAIATMAQNRARYGQVWNRAKELLLARGAYEPALIAYVDRLADPTMTRSAMDRAISATMQSMNVSPYDLAKRFFVTGGESIVEFTNMLRQNLPDMDEDSFKYLSDALSKRFAERMEERRTRMIEQLSKQYDASGSKILQRKKKEIKQQTIDQLIDVAFKKSLDIEAIRRTWANRMGLASISDDMKNKIYDTMKKIARMTDDEQRENAYFDLVKEISAQMPGDSYDKFLAWRRFAMLMSPVSWIKNGVSNIVSMPFYFMSDQLENAFNKMAGNEIPADKRIAGKRWIRKGDVLLESAVAHYASPERIKRMVESSAKYSIGKLIAQEKRIFGNSTIEKITKVPYHVMSEGKFTEDSDASVLTRWLGDTYMFERHFKAAFRNRLIAIGYTTETDTDARIALAKRAADDAYEVAIIRTYRKVNTLAAKLNSLKSSREVQARVQRELDKGNIDAARSIQRSATALNGLIDIMVPFVVTPVAIVEQGVKFSPLALVYQTARLVGYEVNSKILHKEIPAMQLSNIHKGLAQALSGTIGQFGVGLLLGLLGFLTGAPPENEKEKKEWAQKGKKAYSLYIPGSGSLSLDWMQPVSMTLMMGAQFANTWLDSDKDLAGFGESSVASLEALFTNSIIKTIQTQFGGSYDTTLAGSAKDIAIDAAMQGLPGIVRRFNRFIDPYERDIYNGSTINVLANRVLSHVPFASFAIAPKVDIWGNEVRQTRDTGVVGTVERFALNMLSPFIYQGADKDPLTVEVSRLFNTTSDSDAIPIVPSRDFAKEYDLVGNDWANFQKIFGNLQHEYATIVMESERYKKADDATRVKYIRKAYTEASKDAKEQYIEQYIDTEPNP